MMRHERGGLRVEPEDIHAPVSAQSSAPSSQSYEIEIDEVVLTGFTRPQGEEIADSLKEALTHLVAADGARWHGSESMNVETLDAGKVQMRRSGHPKSTGELVARAIYGSLPK
ncbi:MAG: hypothetical protein KF722_10985 [Nitrospira sp.]|nr:hypothetical protein [Nitrospira sp.]